MAREVITAAGTIVGAYFGYPGLGYAIGSMVGNAVDPVVIQGPKPSDLAQQTSTEGGPIPIVYGVSHPIAGNLVYCSPADIQWVETGGKGGGPIQKDAHIYRTYAIGICRGPIKGISRIWRNGSLVYDATKESAIKPGPNTSTEDWLNYMHNLANGYSGLNTRFLKGATIYAGDYDQMPDPHIEAKVGTGNAPAMRGISYLVVHDEDLTSLGGAVPRYQFEVFTEGLETDAGAGIIGTWKHDPDYNSNSDLYLYRAPLFERGEHRITGKSNNFFAGVATTADGKHLMVKEDTTKHYVRMYTMDDTTHQYILDPRPQPWSYKGSGINEGEVDISWDGKRVAVWCRSGDAPFVEIFMLREDGSQYDLTDTVQLGSGGQAAGCIKFSPRGTYLVATLDDYNNPYPNNLIRPGVWRINGEGKAIKQWEGDPDNDIFYANECVWTQDEYYLFGCSSYAASISNDCSMYVVANQTLTRVWTSSWRWLYHQGYAAPAGPLALSPDEQFLIVSSMPITANAQVYQIDYFLGQEGADKNVQTIECAKGYGFSWDGAKEYVLNNRDRYTPPVMDLYKVTWPYSGNTIVALEQMPAETPVLQQIYTHGFSWNTAAGPAFVLKAYNLARMVRSICNEAGIGNDQLDVSELEGQDCLGYTVTNTYPGYGAIKGLQDIFLFDISSHDGILHFVRRGKDTSVVVHEGDFVVQSPTDDAVKETTQHESDMVIPQRLNLVYYDIAGGLSTSLQSSELPLKGRNTSVQTLNSAVVMDADQAAKAVAVNHAVMVENAKATLQFSLADNWLTNTVADAVFLQYQGRTRRVRLTQENMDDGVQSYTAIVDRQSAYTSDVQGYPIAPPPEPPVSVVGPTLAIPLDIPIIDDSDDFLGCYLALGALGGAWVGATVDISLDGGQTFVQSLTLNQRAEMFQLNGVLGDHPAEYPDQRNTVEALALYPDDDIEDADLAALQNGANLACVDAELLQVGGADEASEGTWELSYFLRGRRYTETTQHAAGATLVMLERERINYLPMQVSWIGREVTLRVTTLNGDPDLVQRTVTFTYRGNSQREFPVGYLQARAVDDVLTVTWQGAGRLGSGAGVAQGAKFVGYRVTVTGTGYSHVETVVTQEYTLDVSSAPSTLTVKVEQMNQITGAGQAASVTTQKVTT